LRHAFWYASTERHRERGCASRSVYLGLRT